MRNREHALHSYVTDMLALEEHFAKALAGQGEDMDEDHPVVATEVKRVHAIVDSHIEQLRMLASQIEGGPNTIGAAVKRAGSIVLGVGAAAVDFVRHEKVAKAVRDDYTAASLAYAGYVMLLTTASALEDRDTARIASRFARDHDDIRQRLAELLPVVVTEELANDGFPVYAGTMSEVEAAMADAINAAP